MYRNLDLALKSKEGLVWAIESSDVPKDQIDRSSSSDDEDPQRDALIERDISERRRGWSSPAPVFFHLVFLLNRTCLLYVYLSLCIKYGFFQFTLTYAVIMMMVGVPIMLVLITIGQYSGETIVDCWAFVPILRGIGVCLMILSILQVITEFTLAGRSIYLSVALQSVKSLPAMTRSCEYAGRTGYCYNFLEYPEGEIVCKNLSTRAKELHRKGLYFVNRKDWGQCGILAKYFHSGNSELDQMYTYNWRTVVMYNSKKARNSFRFGRVPVADLLSGRMRLGFSMESTAGKLHSSYLTFVAVVAYAAYLLTIMLQEKSLKVLQILMYSVTTLAMIVVTISAHLEFKVPLSEAFQLFAKWDKSERSLFQQPVAWVEAVLLILWVCGASNGDLIHLGSKSTWNCSFFATLFYATAVHICRNLIASITLLVMLENRDTKILLEDTKGFIELLFESQAHLLLTKFGYYGLVPLLCLPIESVAFWLSQSGKLISALKSLVPSSAGWDTLAFTVLFIFIVAVSRFVCSEYSTANIYSLIDTHFGWHSVTIVILQLLALWCYTSKDGFLTMLKIMGVKISITQFSLWLRICWEGYTTTMLTLTAAILIFIGVNNVVSGVSVVEYGLLNLHSREVLDSLMSHQLTTIVVRLACLLPILLVPTVYTIVRFFKYGTYDYSRAVLHLTVTRNPLWKAVRHHGALMERFFKWLKDRLVALLQRRQQETKFSRSKSTAGSASKSANRRVTKSTTKGSAKGTTKGSAKSATKGSAKSASRSESKTASKTDRIHKSATKGGRGMRRNEK